MPKRIHEIKNFNVGTITTPSDADLPEEAANYSLNINAVAEDGVLKGSNKDIIIPVASSYSASTTSSGNYNNGASTIDVEDSGELSGVEDGGTGKITFIDTLGKRQILNYTKSGVGGDTLIVSKWHGSGGITTDTPVYQYTKSDIKSDKISLINDSGTYRAVIFDDADNKFKTVDNIDGDRPTSSNLSSTAETHSVLPTMVNNNKEVHIGMGSGANDTPKWIGKIGHGQYGESAPSGLQLTNAKLIQPNTLPDIYKPVTDNTHIYGFEYASNTIWKLKISDYSLVKKSMIIRDDATTASLTAICMGSDGDLWVIDTSTIDYKVSEGVYQYTADSSAITGNTLTTLGTWMRIDANSLEIKKSGLLQFKKTNFACNLPYWPLVDDVSSNADANNHWIITDLIEVANNLWISGAVGQPGSNTNNANWATHLKGKEYLFLKPTSAFSNSGTVTLLGDRGGQASSNYRESVGYGLYSQPLNGHARGGFKWHDHENQEPLYCKIPKLNLIEISGTSNVGIIIEPHYSKLHEGLSRDSNDGLCIDGTGDGTYVEIGTIIVEVDIAMYSNSSQQDDSIRPAQEVGGGAIAFKGGIHYITEGGNDLSYDGYTEGLACAHGKIVYTVPNSSTSTSSDIKYKNSPSTISGNTNSSIQAMAVASTTYDINKGKPCLLDNGSNVDIHMFAGDGNGRWMSSTNTGNSIGADIFTVRFQSELELKLTNTTAPSSHESGKKYYYKASYIYDGYQESPLGDPTIITSTGKSVDIEVILRTTSSLSKRISGIALYMAESAGNAETPTGFYRYLTKLDLNNTFTTVNEDLSGNPDWGSYRSRIFNHNGSVSASYEARTGISEILEDTIVNYSLSTDLNSHLFVAGCSHEKIDDASNYLFKSRPYNYSMFNWIKEFLVLPIYPTALQSFNNRLFALDDNSILRIEPNTLYIESATSGIGCFGQESILANEFGMCFADKNGIYLHDGQRANDISLPIKRGDSTYSWENILLDFIPKVGFDSYTKSFVVVFKASNSTYNAWQYNIPRRRWDLQKLFHVNGGSLETAVPKDFVINKNNKLIWNINGEFYQVYGDKNNFKSWDWHSKQITIGKSTQDKSFTNFNLIGSPSGTLGTQISVNLDDSNASEIVNDGASGYNNFKLSPTKGKKVQWRLISQTGTIDALGTTYRLLKTNAGASN